MNKDTFAKMVEDGRGIISVLNSVQEDNETVLHISYWASLGIDYL